MFRKLKAHEIDVRTQSIVYHDPSTKKKEKGAILLLYKDARCDMNILDETVGHFNWKREHSRDNANCSVSIWDANKSQWISKEDTGTESFSESEKGLASDSFKRACFNWGIGRELYTAPFIWVNKEDVDGTLKYARYQCKTIGYDDKGVINELEIICNGKTVFLHGRTAPKAPTKPKDASGDKPSILQQQKLIKELYSDEDIKKMLTNMGKENLSDITFEQAEKMIAHVTKNDEPKKSN